MGIFSLLISLLFLSATAHAESFSGRLVKVIDGDTVEILHDGKAERIRLAQIDAPEQGQAFGQAAKKYLLDIAAQKVVTIKVETVDRYGRTVGEIFLPDGTNLNKEIVGAGYAWEYKRYSHDREYEILERKARISGWGLWQEANPIPPWEWRRGKRKNLESNIKKANFICGAKRYCREMTSCSEAKFYMKECGLSQLDGDGDRVPCEAICR